MSNLNGKKQQYVVRPVGVGGNVRYKLSLSLKVLDSNNSHPIKKLEICGFMHYSLVTYTCGNQSI